MYLEYISKVHFIFFTPFYILTFFPSENSTPEIFAGSGRKGNNDGLSHESEFDCPYGIVYDNETNTCFITDARNHRIRAIHF